MNYKDLQDQLEKYFKDVSDAHFILFVNRFVYHNVSELEEVNKIFMDFLEENHLTGDFANYEFDLDRTKYFLKCSYSARSVIEDIKMTLLSLSFNRFREATHNLLK